MAETEKMINMFIFNKTSIVKIIFLAIVCLVALFKFQFDFLDLLLLLYLGVTLLFAWGWQISLYGGISLFAVTLLLKYTRPDFDITRLNIYRWWFLGSGVALAARDWLKGRWRYEECVKLVRYWFLKITVLSIAAQRFSHNIASKITLPTINFDLKIVLSLLVLARRISYIVLVRILALPKITKDGIVLIQDLLKTFIAILKQQCSSYYSLFCKRFSLMTRIKMAGFVIITLVLFFVTKWEVVSIIFIIFLLAIILFNLDSRIAITGSFIGAVTIPFLYIINKESLAEVVALFVYYFLVVGATERLIENGLKWVRKNIRYFNKRVLM